MTPHTPPAQPRYLVISPVRDEANFLQRTIDSMIAQTHRPARWIIVDDGSSDATPEIATQAAREHDWIDLHRRTDRGTRHVGGGVIDAFYDGLSQVTLDDYDFICKLDGDLSFEPTCFEQLIRKFDANPRLGTASGKCWDKTPAGWVPLRTNDDFSLGACKFYRVACFRDIGGFVSEVMWDGIDCHRCRMKGWDARSFDDDALRVYEHRPMGSSHKSIIHGRLRWGRGQYFMGTHPLYALAIACYRLFEHPRIIGGCSILAGYLWAALTHRARYNDPEFRRHLHHWQLARLARWNRPINKPVPSP